MSVTRVKIYPCAEKDCCALAVVYLNDALVINDIRVIRYSDGRYRAIFPRSFSGEFAVTPIKKEMRSEIEKAIVKEMLGSGLMKSEPSSDFRREM